MPVKKSANNFEKMIGACSEDKESTLMRSVNTAIEGINSAVLYSSVPFEKSTELRNCLEDYIQKTAEQAYEKAKNEIDSGAERNEVIKKYTDNTAFDEWFDLFKEELDKIVYEK